MAFAVLAALLIFVFAVEAFNLDTSYNVTIYTVFLGILVTAMTNNISHLYKKLAGDNKMHTREIALLGKTIRAGTSLLTLEQVIDDLDRRLRIAPGGQVAIEHLGITMEHAWDHVERVLLRLASIRGVKLVRYHLVMLHRKKGSRRGQFPAEVADWIDLAERKRNEILEALDELEQSCPAFHGDIRFYHDIPIVHGVRIKEPTGIAYVAFTRWASTGTKFKAGIQQYHRIDSADVPAQGDLLTIFDGYFRHLWREGQTAASLPRPRARAKTGAAVP